MNFLSFWQWFYLVFILIPALHNYLFNDDLLIFFIAVSTVYVRELMFSFGNSASSKLLLTTGHHS